MAPKARVFIYCDALTGQNNLTQPLIKLYHGNKRQSRSQRPKFVVETPHEGPKNFHVEIEDGATTEHDSDNVSENPIVGKFMEDRDKKPFSDVFLPSL